MIRGVDLVALSITLILGSFGGLIAHTAHLPLGYLLGSLLVIGGLAALGIRPFGRAITLPAKLRFSFVPVIGVAIGGAFTPAVAGQITGWGPSLLALCLYVPIAHAVGYAIYRKGGLPRAEALFGAVPGGLLESVQLGEEAGADVRLLTALQFLRLILTIISVPLIFLVLTGHAVGSASGVQMAVTGQGLDLKNALGLLVAAVGGAVLGRVLRLPGGIITGPIALSAALHATGWVQGVPPPWLVAMTQIVLGTGLGARFAGIERRTLIRAGGLALINGAAALTLALIFALTLHALVDEPIAAVFLAFAPGGLAEMSLIALSLHMSAIYVTAHHVARIVLAVTVAKLGQRFVPRGP